MSTLMGRDGGDGSGGGLVQRGERLKHYLARRETPPERSSPGTAAKAVATDVSELVRAELQLAKDEVAQIAKEKALGLGLALGAAVLMWLVFQGLLITIALALALVLQNWAAAGLVTLVLLLVAGLLGFLGYKRLTSAADVEVTKGNVEDDLALAKAARGRVGSR